MKKSFSLIFPAFVAMCLFCDIAIADIYKPGVYTVEALGRAGRDYSGLIRVEVTISETKIEDIKILEYDQSLDHKQYGPPTMEAREEIPRRILEKNSIDVDAIARATMSSSGIQIAVAKALEQATIKYKSGVYTAEALGRAGRDHSGLIRVEVTVSETKIEDIKILEYDQSLDHKQYGPPTMEAREEIPRRILEKNSIGVDAIARATMSSSGIQIAVAKALEQARIR